MNISKKKKNTKIFHGQYEYSMQIKIKYSGPFTSYDS